MGEVPRDDYKTCRGCGRSSAEVGLLSHIRLCEKCGEERYTDNLNDLVAHSGTFFQHWRRRMAESVGGVILDGKGRDT